MKISLRKITTRSLVISLFILALLEPGAAYNATQDESQTADKKASANGDGLSEQKPSRKGVIKLYEKRLRRSRAAGDRRQEATALLGLGTIYEQMGERQKALDYLNQALPIWQDLGDYMEEAYILCMLGKVSLKWSEDKKANDYFRQAISVIRMTGDSEKESGTLWAIGSNYLLSKQPEKAIEFLQQALELFRSLGKLRDESQILRELEDVYALLGDYQSAANYGAQLKWVDRKIEQGDTASQGRQLIAADEAYAQAEILASEQSRESLVKAIGKLEEALKLYKEAGNRIEEERVLTDIGRVYMYLGQYKKSVAYFEQSLLVSQAIADRSGEAYSLARIGEVYLASGDKQKALDYASRSLLIFRALGEPHSRTAFRPLVEPNSQGEEREVVQLVQIAEQRVLDYANRSSVIFRVYGKPHSQAFALGIIARIWFAMGDKRKAHEYWDQAISFYQEDNYWKSVTLLDIGHAYLSVREFEEALRYFNQCLQLRRDEIVGDANRELEETSLRSDIARIEFERGNLAGARSQIETILTTVESLRSNIVSQDLRVSYFSSARKYYEFYIDLLMRLHKEQPAEGHDAAALQASERARARSLVELLIEARADIRQGADLALVNRERSLRDRINAIDKNLLMSDGKLTKVHAAEASIEIELLTSQYQQVRALIRARSPRYAALTQPQALSLKEIQQSVLDPDTSLLEYALGDERSYLWLVTQTSILSYELPKRSDVEAAARRVYELLTARQQVAGRTDAERPKRIAKADAEFQMAGMALSKMLLGPVSSELRTRRLLIVADGALQFVPFAALPMSRSVKNAPQQIQNGTQTHGNNIAPLISEHEIVSLPSASALAVLRRETAGREYAGKAIAVLADPVFDREDPRVRLGEETKLPALKRSFNLERAMRDVALHDSRGNLSRLPFSREEAEAILAVAPQGQAFKAIDFKASRAILESHEMSKYGIVHFATHALLNSKHPELSGIVLSLVDEQGRAQDGFLRLHDIYNLNLPAELVVLSACQTALGKEVKGEGLLGLTRGFMYSGAKQVMASLWKVDDGATAEFMRDFYQGVFKRGLKPAAALRAAQIEMRKKKQWRPPYFWAAFVLQGEYR